MTSPRPTFPTLSLVAALITPALAAAVWAGSSTAAAQAGELKRRWEGTIVYTQTLHWDTDEGDIVSRLELDVRWRERERIDVIDESGRAVGQLILLEDDGSSWTGTLQGTTTRRDSCSMTVSTFEGSGSGSRTITAGWVYFSLVEDDPLAERIPSGTYFLAGDPREQFTGTATVVIDRFCDPPSRSTFTSEYPGGLIGLQIGREPISWPNAVPGGRLPVSAILAAYEQADALNFDALPIAHADGEKRRLIDGAMVGSYVAGGDDLRWVAEWDVRRKLDVAIVLDEPERDWWPMGGGHANTITLRARLDSPSLEGRFRFRLAEVTSEPGYALNAGTETGKDLEFAADQPGFEAPVETDDGWTIEGTEAVNEVEIVVGSRDYGAWGRLSCQVLVDGDWYECETGAGEPSVTLPVDEDLDLIADSWAEDNAAGGSDDADAAPGGTEEDNDGLSNYEEYRGIVAQGVHYRSDPTLKTVFLRDDQGLARSTTALAGFDLFYLTAGELGGDSGQVVNFNQCSGAHADHHLADQHAVRVTNGGASATWNWGCAFPCRARRVGPPSTCTEARIYVPQIAVDMASWSQGQFRGLTGAMTRQVADHEIGHCLGAHHHDVDAPGVAATPEDGPLCTMRYYFQRIFNGTITAADIGTRFCSSITMPKIDLSDPS